MKKHGRRKTDFDLPNKVWWAYLAKILLVALRNNSVDVLEERLQRNAPVLDETSNIWVMFFPKYGRLVS